MTEPTPGLKALLYAEEQLGVNSVYVNVLDVRDRLNSVLTDLSNCRDRKRDVDARLDDAILEVAAEERGKHPDMSAAGMERHLKVELAKSDTVRELREQLTKVVGDIDGLECDKLIFETDIRIAVARLNELGGYFEYLAVIKNHEPVTQVQQTESKGPWE